MSPQWGAPAPEDRPGPEYSELAEGANDWPAGMPGDVADMPAGVPDMPAGVPDMPA
jgi:hypothetical protein